MSFLVEILIWKFRCKMFDLWLMFTSWTKKKIISKNKCFFHHWLMSLLISLHLLIEAWGGIIFTSTERRNDKSISSKQNTNSFFQDLNLVCQVHFFSTITISPHASIFNTASHGCIWKVNPDSYIFRYQPPSILCRLLNISSWKDNILLQFKCWLL